MIELGVGIQILSHGEGFPLPAYATVGSAGMDLWAAVEEPVVLEPGQRCLVPTGFRIALPEGYEAQIRPRSGLAIKRGIMIVNAPGTVDSNYRGEVKVGLVNLSDSAYTIRRGDRIAQMVVAPVTRVAWRSVPSLDETDRGAGGFGSTGS
ncbi:MAG: dUTP diphosphatase [Anaerolineae bacterium]|nr:dUTP diphosphatase [Anaerolineae bacterium]